MFSFLGSCPLDLISTISLLIELKLHIKTKTLTEMVNNSRRLHKLEKFVSDPYLLYLANKNMLKLKKEKTVPPI